MADSYGNSPSKYRLLFVRKSSNSGNIAVLTSIKSICEDDHIEKLEDNQWKCLWCDVTFQGINATKALDHVIGTKIMHIKRCKASIDQAHLSRYKKLQKIKAAKKDLLKYYSQKLSLSHHAYRTSHQKLLSQIFSVNQGICTYQILLQYMIHPLSAKVLANLLKATKQLLKKVQYFSRETITHRRWWLLMRLALQLQLLISLFLKVYLSIYLRNLGSRRCWS